MFQPWVEIIRGRQARVTVRREKVGSDQREAEKPEPTPFILNTGHNKPAKSTASAQLPAWYAKPMKYSKYIIHHLYWLYVDNT